MSANRDCTVTGINNTADDGDECRLTRAIRTKQGQDFTRLDVQAYILQRLIAR